MCGIFGVVSDGVTNPGEFYRFLSLLLSESERRGADAAGFAAVVDGKFVADKRNITPTAFSKLSKVWKTLRGGHKLSLIGHTRAATEGSPKDNNNNHPFHGPRLSMAHNGGVHRHAAIASSKGIKLQTGCDSEIILHILERRLSIRDGIIDAFSILDSCAMMAVCALDRNNGDIHLFRDTISPCVVLKFPRWNATVFASSTPIIINAASTVLGSFGRVWENTSPAYRDNIPPYSHVSIRSDGSIDVVDLDDDINFTQDIKRRFGLSNYLSSNLSTYGGDYSQDGSNKNDEDTTVYFICRECTMPIDDNRYRGALHEEGGGYLCDACFTTKVKKNIAISSENSKNTRLSVLVESSEIDRIIPHFILHRNIDDRSEILTTLEEYREPKRDYDLDHYDISTYMSIAESSIDDKICSWSSMTMKRIYAMNDGEYLAYSEFLEEALSEDI